MFVGLHEEGLTFDAALADFGRFPDLGTTAWELVNVKFNVISYATIFKYVLTTFPSFSFFLITRGTKLILTFFFVV